MRRGDLPGLTIKNDRLAMKHAGFGWFCHEKGLDVFFCIPTVQLKELTG
jgi:hypothetical protein